MHICRCTWVTEPHKTFGQCARSKNIKVAYCRSSVNGGDYSEQKKWDRELDAYSAARREGIQPDSTNMKDIQRAVSLSDQYGEAYGNTG